MTAIEHLVGCWLATKANCWLLEECGWSMSGVMMKGSQSVMDKQNSYTYVGLLMVQRDRSGQLPSQHWLSPLPWGRRSPAWSGRTWKWGRRPEEQHSPQGVPSPRYQQLHMHMHMHKECLVNNIMTVHVTSYYYYTMHVPGALSLQ